MMFYSLTIAEKHQETPDSVSLWLDVPKALQDVFDIAPGQFVSVKIGTAIRQYSVSKVPTNDRFRITVKQQPSGEVSTWLNQTVQAGEVLQVSAPAGHFVIQPEINNRRTLYCVVAGSGITPVMHILEAVLHQEPATSIVLLYGNRNRDSVIFYEELEALARAFPEQLRVCHCWSSPGWFGTDYWRKGRIDQDAVAELMKAFPPYAQDCRYLVCGSGDFTRQAVQALKAIDVPEDRLLTEQFAAAKGRGQNTAEPESMAATLTVNTTDGKAVDVTVKAGQTLLQALKQHPLDVPYSCEGGVCGSCRCQLESGDVRLKHNAVLTAEEISRGVILTCQAIPGTEALVVRY